jgi:hypothetical protein
MPEGSNYNQALSTLWDAKLCSFQHEMIDRIMTGPQRSQ